MKASEFGKSAGTEKSPLAQNIRKYFATNLETFLKTLQMVDVLLRHFTEH